MVKDFENRERVKRYKLAMKESPSARNAELKTFNLFNYEFNKAIDFGCGEGYLTRYLRNLNPEAIVVSVDESSEMTNKNFDNFLTIRKMEEVKFEVFDLITSLGVFHHIQNKKETLQNLSNVLSEDGEIIIADVYDNTPTQNFFDNVVDKYSVTGHKYPFLDKKKVSYLCKEIGIKYVLSKLEDTPWRFNSKDQMLSFVSNLFALKINGEILQKKLESHFQIKENKGEYTIPWQLGYHVLRK